MLDADVAHAQQHFSLKSKRIKARKIVLNQCLAKSKIQFHFVRLFCHSSVLLLPIYELASMNGTFTDSDAILCLDLKPYDGFPLNVCSVSVDRMCIIKSGIWHTFAFRMHFTI